MGQVFEATHAELGKRFAIKFLNPDLAASTEAVRRFQQEIRSLGQLDHPNLLQAVDAGDRFKSVNDSYGHLAGDSVLSEFCCRVNTQLRSGQLLARLGGEEFAVLCTHGSLDQALETAESIRQVTCAAPFLFEGRVIPVSVSIGVATAAVDTTVSSNDLLNHADRLLYLAKASGRNQVKASGEVT